MYSWDWNEKGIELGAGDQPTVGVIAQDVLESKPDAVGEKAGYLTVNYETIFRK